MKNKDASNRLQLIERFETIIGEQYAVFLFTDRFNRIHLITVLGANNHVRLFPKLEQLQIWNEAAASEAGVFLTEEEFTALCESSENCDASIEKTIKLLDEVFTTESGEIYPVESDSKDPADRLVFVEQLEGNLAFRSLYFYIYKNSMNLCKGVGIYSHGNGYADIYVTFEEFFKQMWSPLEFGKRLESVTWDFFENRESLEGLPYELENGLPVVSETRYFERWLVNQLDAAVKSEEISEVSVSC